VDKGVHTKTVVLKICPPILNNLIPQSSTNVHLGGFPRPGGSVFVGRLRVSRLKHLLIAVHFHPSDCANVASTPFVRSSALLVCLA
jgi:hypothetical protein